MRIVVSLVALCFGAFALFVFEAAGSAAAIIDRSEQAQLTNSPTVRASLLKQAEAIVQQDPLSRTLWHAGAAEGASLTSFVRALSATSNQDRQAQFRASRDFALRAVQADPAAASSWLRLAFLDELGISNSACPRKTCLERAFKAAPIGDPLLACPRADAALRAGLITQASDPRIQDLETSGVRSWDLAQCIPSASAQILFRTMLQFRQSEARREKS